MGVIKRGHGSLRLGRRRRPLQRELSAISSIKRDLENRRDELLGGKFKKITWTRLVDESGRMISKPNFKEEVVMMGPRVNTEGAPVHLGVFQDRLVVLKMSKRVDTNLAYTNPPMRTEFIRAKNIERLAPGISTPHIALAAPYPMKSTKTTQVMLIMEYRLCSLGDFVKRLASHPSADFKRGVLKTISEMGFGILRELSEKANYVHMDIKPDNLLVNFVTETSFKLELTDFGISAERGILQVFSSGTPFYSAREQQSPEKRDRRTSPKWDTEAWVLSVVGMAADLKLIPEPGFRRPGLKVKDYHDLKSEFFRNFPRDLGDLIPDMD
jgi:serine/threonine protein kinase